MWKNIEEQLNEIKVEDLGYDHLLCSGILDISSTPFTKMAKDICNHFNVLSDKFSIPFNKAIMNTCENFVHKEKEKKKISDNNPKSFGNARYGEFLDGSK